uniref:Uncharacterized protein n=1 Tax=Brassica campestris TaxID=3711 RepID=A0A3P6B029_BRACM|nr:unnamed protein product [Brassica rapa]
MIIFVCVLVWKAMSASYNQIMFYQCSVFSVRTLLVIIFSESFGKYGLRLARVRLRKTGC